MAEERFDLSFRGLIAPGADPEGVRRRLTAIFKLTDQGAERLFTGKPVIVKRNVDRAAAAQFERIFANAGAVLDVTPLDPTVSSPHQDVAEAGPSSNPKPLNPVEGTRLALLPPGGVLEEPPPSVSPGLNIGYLSLVPGDDWTLEDCQPPPTPIPEPDLSYLSLAPPDPDGADRDAVSPWRAD